MRFPRLNNRSLREGLRRLSETDADLREIVREFGPPPLWLREPGFPTLIHIILEQQVSLASAKAAFDKLLAATRPLTPENFLRLDDDSLRILGFSRQKTDYTRGLARAILDGRLDLIALESASDAEVREKLMALKGVGSWTAEIYLLMALGRRDAWPRLDLGLLIAVQRVKKLAARPSPDEMSAIAEAWRPWRAVATRILWHDYLSRQRKKKLLVGGVP